MSMQPIIRGVQNVGQVELRYRYLGPEGKLRVPATATSALIALTQTGGTLLTEIDTGSNSTAGILVAGFRLDSEFVRANPQIASSIVIPLLGGGGIALTNNNRTGTLRLRCTKVSVPDTDGSSNWAIASGANSQAGVISEDSSTKYYDLVTLAQIQQSQSGGDSYGAELSISFQFANVITKLTFEMCTVQTVDPLGLAGNDAADYDVVFNYLNWKLAQKAA